MTVRLIKSPRVRYCLACDRKLNVFQTLLGRRFCSPKHEADHIEELSNLALARLEETDLRFRKLIEQIDVDTPANFPE